MTTLPASSPRTVQQILSDARQAVGPAHHAAIDVLPEPLRHIAGYHAGWWSASGEPETSGGKALRPALVLAASSAVGGPPMAAVREAVAVELVHDFTLLHDDIMDGDATRRHRPAAWMTFGIGAALLTGDALQALACELLAEQARIKILTTTLMQLCVGQSADLDFEQRTDVSLAECRVMPAGKTGALLACACELGALAGGADARGCALLAEFGMHLGLSFQFADDVLNIWGDPTVTGKPVYSDLARRKKSLPVVAALTSGTRFAGPLEALYGQPHDGDTAALAHLATLIEAAGGREFALQEADRQLRDALACISAAAPNPSATADAVALAQLITRRDH
ncbi:polyprenyl synthetase family protein [Corallococcus terminator]